MRTRGHRFWRFVAASFWNADKKQNRLVNITLTSTPLYSFQLLQIDRKMPSLCVPNLSQQFIFATHFCEASSQNSWPSRMARISSTHNHKPKPPPIQLNPSDGWFMFLRVPHSLRFLCFNRNWRISTEERSSNWTVRHDLWAGSAINFASLKLKDK